MRLPVFAALFFFTILVFPACGIAQYMFLDSNGDGVLTAADVVNPTGPTTVDVWLRTNTNRNGSAASCASQDGDLTINGYEFVLRASNGTVAWSGFVNRLPGVTVSTGEISSPAEYHNEYGLGPTLPPGTYLLATLTVTVATRTPSISIEPATLTGASLTSFGSSCSGYDQDYSLKLGSDWLDADGIPYGGVANRPPTLVQPVDMTVAEGTVREQELIGTDPDGDPVTFALVSGPSYVSVMTVDPDSGNARGSLRVAPGYRDAGTATVQIEASDGLQSSRKAMTVVVTDVNAAPTMTPLGDLTLREGEVVERPLSASDPEDDPVTFSLAAGPRYVSVVSYGGITPAGLVRAAPGFADAGSSTATISASDGFLIDQKSFHLTVTDPYPVHNEILCRPGAMLVPVGTVVEQTLHAVSPDGQPITFLKMSGPDFLTVATTSSNPAAATGKVIVAPGATDVGAFTAVVAATDGIATAPQSFKVAVGDARALPNPGSPPYDASSFTSEVGRTPQSLAAADLDGDGDLDLITANLSQTLTILRGNGDGTFDRRDDFPVGESPYSATAADFNGDGHPDIVMVDSTLDVVSVIDGIGGCLFGHRRDYQVGVRPAHVKVGDWNADGRLDLAVTDEGGGTISILMGAGDGTFGPRTAYSIGLDPCYSDAGDLNGDGYPDLVTANEQSNTLTVLLGNGDGTFRGRVDYGAGSNPRALKIGDFNGDGRPDIVAANFWGNSISVLLGNGDGTFRDQNIFPTGVCPWSIAIGDLNADGHLDVVTADVCESSVSVLFGDGSGSFANRFSYPSGRHSRFVVLGDANGDGRLDIFVSCETGNDVVTMVNDGRGNFFAGVSYGVDAGTADAVAGDWNGDGRKDLALVNGVTRTVSVFLSLGDGTLAPGQDIALTSEADRLVTGDWNQDGKADLAAAFVEGPDAFAAYFGRGDGTFALGAAYPGATGYGEFRSGDVNADGRTDLILSSSQSSTLSVMLGETGGAFLAGSLVAMAGVAGGFALGDLNGDGKPDLAAAVSSPDEIEILIGDGSGGFVPGAAIAASPHFSVGSPILADLNRDGVLDLSFFDASPFTFEGGNLMRVAKGRGDGTFDPSTAYAVPAFPGGLISLDANGDGRADLVFPHEAVAVCLFLGLGNGEFAPKLDFGAGTRVTGITPIDLNGDGRVDLGLTSYGDNQLVVLLNRGTFTPVDQAPVVAAPAAVASRAGSRVQLTVTAADPDGDSIDALTADLSGLPAGSDVSFAVNADHTSGAFAWATLPADVGTFAVHFTAANARSGSATTRIEVGPPNRPPTADAGGPYAGSAGIPVHFDGRGSSDPDGDALTMMWQFGDGASGVGVEPAHTYAAEGTFQVILEASDGYASATDGATATISGVLPARAFTSPENKVIRLASARPATYLQLEPVDGSFQIENVDLASVVLRSQGTRSVDEIHAASGKNAPARDRDRNGVLELSLTFARDDLRLLFGSVTGRATLPVTLEGSVETGARFRADLQIEVQGASHFPSVTVAPNPMNPAAVLTVQTSRRGRLRAALFDAGGRMVRLLTDLTDVPTGFHEVRFDGRALGGAALASGIYFYRVDSADGTAEGRIVMIR
ncbi:MAG: PKD domain-containing protein [Candidatus Eisenbacteria bacterium]|uniref:PKD domain-containing protein n=1 Tax=Eiseniibacteriota bacterium TaxID=2212470 RepID=A0A538TGT7_UNCEI|nr:MAG: PKD domain-containing protein [Candidatus Eisenbacteria bacterium]